MDACDVLIVGGGPAGSACAWKLKQAGVDVVVLDKAQFPRHKVCAGWITPPILDELKFDIADYQRDHTLQPITRFLTGMIGCAAVETDYGRVVSYGIRRCEFDDYLLRRAQARLRLGETFRSMRRDNGRWVVNETHAAPIVIGAGGHFCPVARQVMATNPPGAANSGREALPTVMAQEIEFELTGEQQAACSVAGDRPELYFCPDLKGYGWLFRKGTYLNVGLGREGETQLSAHVATFVDWLASQRKIPQLPDRFHGHAYRLRTSVPHAAPVKGVLLIGDALGLADQHSGEGIRPAIESGLLAAQSLLDAAAEGHSDPGPIYDERLRQRFGTSSQPSTGNWRPGWLSQVSARWLMKSPWFARHVLLDRWFLRVADRALVV